MSTGVKSALNVAIVGAGAIGAGLAMELSRRGARVTVYEARRPGEGTSGTSFAWVNSNAKEPDTYHRLNQAGVRAHSEFSRGWTREPWYLPTGNLEWAEDGPSLEELTTRTERLRSIGYGVKRLSVSEATSMEPDLALPPGVDHVVLFTEEGYALPIPMIGRMLGEALDLGADLRYPLKVAAVEERAGGVGIRLEDGTVEAADVVVTCAGRWTPELLSTAGYSLPLLGADEGPVVLGYLGYTRPVALRLSRVLTTPRLNVRPDGGGRLVLQARDLDQSEELTDPSCTSGRVTEEMGRRLVHILRGGDQALVEEVRVGQRAIPADGLTAAGFVDPGRRLYTVVTHSGITLAPLLGRLVADELVQGAPSPLLEPFRPGRLTHPGSRPEPGSCPGGHGTRQPPRARATKPSDLPTRAASGGGLKPEDIGSVGIQPGSGGP
jgi:glycine/D-amino acid oxidase-like deaminating enzyme